MKKRTIEDFINTANQHHDYYYDYTESEYVNTQTKIKIICPHHGPFMQTPKIHLRGSNCPTCSLEQQTRNKYSNIADVLNRANHIHQFKYDYSNVVYTRMTDKVQITCNIHGTFKQTLNNHVNQNQGCPMCSNLSRGKRLNTGEFITKSKQRHGDKIEYDSVNYINNTTPVNLICKKHGPYYQLPMYHLSNTHACPSCAQGSTGYYNQCYFDNNVGAKSTPATLYIIRCESVDEKFIKIGITVQSMKRRFPGMMINEYSVSTVRLKQMPLYQAFLTEQRFIQLFSDVRYIPRHRFHGHTECFIN